MNVVSIYGRQRCRGLAHIISLGLDLIAMHLV